MDATGSRACWAAVVLLSLTGCSGGDDSSQASSKEKSTPSAQPSVFDEAQVMDYLGIEKRKPKDFGPHFRIDSVSYADYRWTAPDGTVCFLSNVITSASEASMAAPDAVLNPAGTAGVEFYADTNNQATCTALLTKALAKFPPQGS
jgi:hypothetical protein